MTYLPPPRGKTNTLAIVGFVLSIVAFLFGTLLSPIALLICFIALFRRPRGLAFVGLIISLIGTAIMATILFLFGFVIVACVTLGQKGATTVMNAEKAHQQIHAYVLTHGAIPDAISGQSVIGSQLDGWGHPLIYRRTGNTSYSIISGGLDGVVGTADDMSQDYFESAGR